MKPKGRPCAYCGKWVEPSKYLNRGYIQYHQRKYCSSLCYRKAMSERMTGRIVSKQTRRKLSETRKKLFAQGILTPTWTGKAWSLEKIIKLMAVKRGIKLTLKDVIPLGKFKRLPKASRSMRGKEHSFATSEALKKLDTLGFRCFNLTKKPFPDAIAISKDGEVFAVETEHAFINPKKYQKHCPYDDILWVVFGRTKTGEIFAIKNSKLLRNDR